jgi:hypothetical protein
MRATNALVTLLLAVVAGRTQVLAPEEIRDPQLRALQEKYRNELKLVPKAAAAHNFPYHFYFSRKLDLEEKDQKQSDQRSVQFDRYQGQVVVKVTGNYFVSYSAGLVKPQERARRTYEGVILPLLEAAVHAFEKTDMPQAFAFEISHHVRRKVLGVSTEAVENVVLVLPKASAQRLVSSADPQVRQAAILEGETFLNAAPISFWPRPQEEIAEEAAPEPIPQATSQTPPPPVTQPAPTVSARLMRGIKLHGVAAKAVPAPPEQPAPSEQPAPTERPAPAEQPAPMRDSSPDAIKELQKASQPVVDRMVQELEAQAHFVGYAPPSFIPFHKGLYLQVSVTTTLPETAAGSQYRLAALAFDQHIAHLIRPVLAFFKDRSDFDGVDFSTTLRLATDSGTDGSPLAVEFIFPLKLLSAYADFDTTGQQLIEAGFVLINGERVSLNLEAAEAGSTPR